MSLAMCSMSEKKRTQLLKTTQRRKLKPRICCVKSKAAILVLCWNTLVTIFVGYFLEYGSVLATVFDYNYVIDSHANQLLTYVPAFFGTLTLLYLFYPLAGCQADIRCGRYSTITNSIWFIIWGGVFTVTGSIIMACYYNNRIISLQAVNVTVILAIGFGLPVFFGMMLLGVSYIYHSVPMSFSLVWTSFMTLLQKTLYSSSTGLYFHYTWVQG